MIYQRHIPEEELFVAQLEALMQNGRAAKVRRDERWKPVPCLIGSVS